MSSKYFTLVASRPSRAIVYRGLQSVSAYLATSIILIGVIVLIDQRLQIDTLRSFLAYVLVASIAAGLEPGTAKSTVVDMLPKSGKELSASMIGASLLKALATSPVVIGLWLASDGQSGDTSAILLAPFITALGFIATDLRVILDVQGRHASAIWLKQGSLVLAIACPGAALLLGYGLAQGIVAACALRFLWMFSFFADERLVPWQWRSFAHHLKSRRWMHLLFASGVGSLSATADRLIALRFLDAAAASAYVLIFEILSKFWFVSYLLAPIVFVKAVEKGVLNSFSLIGYIIIAILAVPFFIFVASLQFVWFGPLESSNFNVWALLTFGAAIVIASFNQIAVVELQASGQEATATLAAVIGLAVAVIVFPWLLLNVGVNGLFVGWVLKTVAESAVLGSATWKSRVR